MSFVFLSAFIFIKVVNVHSISHLTDDKDTIEKCQYCEFYNASEKVADLVPTIQIPDYTNEYNEVVYQVFYKSTTFSNSIFSGDFHNRPPPTAL